MTIEDELLSAWLDGELTPRAAAEMEAKVAGDSRLSELARKHRALDSRLRNAIEEVAKAPVPARLANAVLAPAGEVIAFPTAKPADQPQSWASVPKWAAVAATLLLGVFIGMSMRGPASSLIAQDSNGLYAAASLDHALDTQLASAPTASDTRIGLSFRDRSGEICRSFSGSQSAGLACRDGDRWRVRGLFGPPEGRASEYRMAEREDANLAALIDSTMVGDPFDAAQEKTAQQRGWR